jgi:hypothetical protein
MTREMFETFSLSILSSDSIVALMQWEARLVSRDDLIPSDEDLIHAFRDRAALAKLSKAIRDDLKDVNPAMFPFLFPHQKELLKRKLIRAHFLHALQIRIDEIEVRWDGVKRNTMQCRYYEQLLDTLQHRASLGEVLTPVEQLRGESVASEKPLAWFGMMVMAPVFAKHIRALLSGKAAALKNLFLEIDRKDIYLGWSRALILSVLNLIPQSFSSEEHLETMVRSVGPEITYINFFIVQTCFAIELFSLIKNSVAGAWATRHNDVQVPVWDQFMIQWKQRRFVLMNWCFASAVNIVSFLWTIGAMDIWPWGVFFAVGFRVAQVCFLMLRYDEEQTNHREAVESIQREIRLLQEKHRKLLGDHANTTDEKAQQALKLELDIVQVEVDTLLKKRSRLFVEWRFKSVEFKHHLMFTTGFLIGVAFFSCLLFPPVLIAPAMALVIGLAGAAICFTTILLYTGMRGHFDFAKTEENEHFIHEQLQACLERFQQLKSDTSPEASLKMKQLYLEMRQLTAQSDYQRKVLQHQKVTLYTTMLRDALMPVVMIAALFFAPSGVGLGIVIGALVACVLLKLIVNHYAPKESMKPSFNGAEYQAFLNDPSLEKLHEFKSEPMPNQSVYGRLFQQKPPTDQSRKLNREDDDDEHTTLDFDAGI